VQGLLKPLLHGGTGSGAGSSGQPDFLPDRLEAGTLNGVGLAGLATGISFVEKQGVEDIRRHDRALTGRLLEGLQGIPGSVSLGPLTRTGRRRLCPSFGN
jgi:selenocysteine lyase/cysteine desulfurase